MLVKRLLHLGIAEASIWGIVIMVFSIFRLRWFARRDSLAALIRRQGVGVALRVVVTCG